MKEEKKGLLQRSPLLVLSIIFSSPAPMKLPLLSASFCSACFFSFPMNYEVYRYFPQIFLFWLVRVGLFYMHPQFSGKKMPSQCDLPGAVRQTDGSGLAGGDGEACQARSRENLIPVSALSLASLCELEQTQKLICKVRVWDKLIFKVLPGSSGPWLCHFGTAETSTTPVFQSLIKTKTRPHTLINNLSTLQICLESH